MPYEIIVAESAASAFSLFKAPAAEALLNKLRIELSERPQAAGVALRGALRGYRAIIHTVTYQVIYRVDEKQHIVLVVDIKPLAVAIG